MIIIDGRQTEMQVANFSNLEELLVNVMEKSDMENRVVTDILVNQEQFSEIYPHQAEDIGCDSIESVEVRSMPVGEMAISIAREMYKVTQMMASGGREVARLFRQAEDAEALELFQDLIDVTRDFMGMINVLRNEFSLSKNKEFTTSSENLSSLLAEMIEILENEDWILLADLLEYEFIPVCDSWKKAIQVLREDIRTAVQQ